MYQLLKWSILHLNAKLNSRSSSPLTDTGWPLHHCQPHLHRDGPCQDGDQDQFQGPVDTGWHRHSHRQHEHGRHRRHDRDHGHGHEEELRLPPVWRSVWLCQLIPDGCPIVKNIFISGDIFSRSRLGWATDTGWAFHPDLNRKRGKQDLEFSLAFRCRIYHFSNWYIIH